MKKPFRIAPLLLAGLLGLPTAYAATPSVLSSGGNTASLQLSAVGAESAPATVNPGHYSWGEKACGFSEFIANYIYGKQEVKPVTVAIIGTGVDGSHPMLKGKVLDDGIDLVDNDPFADDLHGNGTSLAGITIDCCGDTPVQILPIRVLNELGTGNRRNVANGIIWAANHGADIICLALGGIRLEDTSIEDAITFATGKGCFVVVASGNDNASTEEYSPAYVDLPGVVIVGAADSDHQRMPFSNYGDNLDLLAPGKDVNAPVLNGEFELMKGTSPATAHVCAAAALLDMATDKTLTPAQLEEKLLIATQYQQWLNPQEGRGFLTLSNIDLPTPEPIEEEEIVAYRYSKQSLTLAAGTSEKLTVEAVYASGKTKNVTENSYLTTSDPSVATVSKDGTITAVSEGTAYISMGMLARNITLPSPVVVQVTGD